MYTRSCTVMKVNEWPSARFPEAKGPVPVAAIKRNQLLTCPDFAADSVRRARGRLIAALRTFSRSSHGPPACTSGPFNFTASADEREPPAAAGCASSSIGAVASCLPRRCEATIAFLEILENCFDCLPFHKSANDVGLQMLNE